MVPCRGMCHPAQPIASILTVPQVKQGVSDVGLAWIYKDKYQ